MQLQIPSVSPCDKIEIFSKGDLQKAFEWLTNRLKAEYWHYNSQRRIFGTITINIPILECKPEYVAAILCGNGAMLVAWKNVYRMNGIPGINARYELDCVNLTFDTPEIGVLNMVV